jgi:hypothetical protein
MHADTNTTHDNDMMLSMMRQFIYDLASYGDKGIDHFTARYNFEEVCAFVDWGKKEHLLPTRTCLPIIETFLFNRDNAKEERGEK